jgi:hypothetical protein
VQARLGEDPEWNGGWYYDSGGAKGVLTELRVEMLKRNGIEAALAARYPDQGACEAGNTPAGGRLGKALGCQLAGHLAAWHDRL